MTSLFGGLSSFFCFDFDFIFFLVKADHGPRPRTKRVKNDCTLSDDYLTWQCLGHFIEIIIGY